MLGVGSLYPSQVEDKRVTRPGERTRLRDQLWARLSPMPHRTRPAVKSGLVAASSWREYCRTTTQGKDLRLTRSTARRQQTRLSTREKHHRFMHFAADALQPEALSARGDVMWAQHNNRRPASLQAHTRNRHGGKEAATSRRPKSLNTCRVQLQRPHIFRACSFFQSGDHVPLLFSSRTSATRAVKPHEVH